MQGFDDWFGAEQATGQPLLIATLSKRVFDVEELPEVGQRGFRLVRGAKMMAFFELPPAMCPARGLDHTRPELANALVSDIGVCQQISLVSLEDCLRADTATVGRVEEAV